MRIIVVGLGIQGNKRLKVAGGDVAATVDPVAPKADYKKIEDVPLGTYDAALVCTPDEAKFPIVKFLLSSGKHVLVESPCGPPRLKKSMNCASWRAPTAQPVTPLTIIALSRIWSG